jgi:hypothetical protein
MSAPSWSHLPFFHAVPVHNAPEASSSTQVPDSLSSRRSGPKPQPQAPTALQSPLEILTIHSGCISSKEIVMEVDMHGNAHVVDKHWESALS